MNTKAMTARALLEVAAARMEKRAVFCEKDMPSLAGAYRTDAEELRTIASSLAEQPAKGDGSRLLSYTPPRALHPETISLVVRFAVALSQKLLSAQEKYGYTDGWKRDDWMDECRAKLVEHLHKGDPRDVAAYCAFLWYHDESTTPQPPDPADGVCWRYVVASALEYLRANDTKQAMEILQLAATPVHAQRQEWEAADHIRALRNIIAGTYPEGTPGRQHDALVAAIYALSTTTHPQAPSVDAAAVLAVAVDLQSYANEYKRTDGAAGHEMLSEWATRLCEISQGAKQ